MRQERELKRLRENECIAAALPQQAVRLKSTTDLVLQGFSSAEGDPIEGDGDDNDQYLQNWRADAVSYLDRIFRLRCRHHDRFGCSS